MRPTKKMSDSLHKWVTLITTKRKHNNVRLDNIQQSRKKNGRSSSQINNVKNIKRRKKSPFVKWRNIRFITLVRNPLKWLCDDKRQMFFHHLIWFYVNFRTLYASAVVSSDKYLCFGKNGSVWQDIDPWDRKGKELLL